MIEQIGFAIQNVVEKVIKSNSHRSKKSKISKINQGQQGQMNLFDLVNISSKPEITSSENSKVKTDKADKKMTNMDKQVTLIDLFSNIASIHPVADAGTEVSKPRIRVQKVNAENYKITDSDKLFSGSLKQKCSNNIKAVEVLKSCIKENRNASSDEQKQLVKYTGWGKLAQTVFGAVKSEWLSFANKIKGLLTPEEYDSARKSSLTAFYTPIPVISFIYSVLDRIGFTGGRILEPSCGIGHFFGCMPDKLRNNTKSTGIECDTISSGICKLLYPNHKIYNSGFEDMKFEDGSYDLVIGNVPFGDYGVHDSRYDKYNFKIHNYFFAKSLDLVRTGGIVALITSHFTMDSKDNSVREYISGKADLIGAVRLPNKTFTDTETLVDIIFLQKREQNTVYSGKEWTQIVENTNGILVNEYYADHPEMIAGNLEIDKNTNQYGKHEIIVTHTGDLKTTLENIIKLFPKNIYEEPDDPSYMFDESEILMAKDYPNIKDNAFADIEDKLYKRHNYSLVPVNTSYSSERRIKALISIRDALETVFDTQLNDSDNGNLSIAQNKLNACYDNYVRNYGYINSQESKRVFGEDPSYPLLSSLEITDSQGRFQKADIFTKRTINYEKPILHADTIEDALTLSLNRNLTIDFGYMAKLTSKPESEIKEYLINQRLIFRNPETNGYETADEYLSGNVVNKLEIAKTCKNADFKYNVECLAKVQPVPLTYADINLKLGSTWIPVKYIKQFITELFNVNIENVELTFVKEMALYKLRVNEYVNQYLNENKFGTSRACGTILVQQILNLKEAKVYDNVWDDEKERNVRVLNKKETILARQKQSDIKNAFAKWIWDNEERRDDIVSIYNRLFNSSIGKKYDGSNLILHGYSAAAPKPRDYQLNAIKRVLCSENTLLAHAVGSGKTLEMVCAGMEMKHLGICNKPMYVVPNSLVESGQFAREFLQFYPMANILIATSKDFAKDKRRKFVSRIATGNWDAIIIGHSSFKFIPVSKDTQERFLQEQIMELKKVIEEFGSERSRTVKAIEKEAQKLEERLERLLDTPKDNTINFEQLGVDQLFIDEAHNFKNLKIVSKMDRVSGVPSISSEKAEDLYMKVRYLLRKNNFRHGVVFATGTPVTNTMAELYVMQKYLMQERLKDVNLDTFDAWASTFGEVVSSVEVNPTGTGYRTKQRFARFYNVPELMNLFREVADIITDDMINLPKPKLENNKFNIVQASMHTELKDFIQFLVKRAENIHNGAVDSTQDNMLCVVNDGKKAALDARLVGINVDYKDSKINLCVDNVYREYINGMGNRLTQIIFCDLGTPKTKGNIKTVEEILGDSNFNVYADIKSKLIQKGIPEKEIAFIHDANTAEKKNKLFAKFKTGEVRILLGSTGKMGEGCNIQDRLIAMHELDCPWKPSELEQREGRILRVGNMNGIVRIYRYCTKGSFDNYTWQTVETKAKFIAQIMNGTSKVRTMEDIDEKVMSYAEMKAACSDNPLIAEKIKTDVEVQRLQTLENGFKRQKYEAETNIKYIKDDMKSGEIFIKKCSMDLFKLESAGDGKFSMNINNKIYTEHTNSEGNKVSGKTDAGKAIIALMEYLTSEQKMKIGEYKGFDVYIEKDRSLLDYFMSYNVIISGNLDYVISCSEGLQSSGLGIIEKIENRVNAEKFKKDIAAKEAEISHWKQEIEGYMEQLTKEFEFADQLQDMLKHQSEINLKLDLDYSEVSNTDEGNAECS